MTALVLLGFAGVLGLLFLSGGTQPILGLDPDRFAQLAATSGLLALVAAGFWHRFRERMGDNLKALVAWGALGAALVAGYAYRDEARSIGDRIRGAVMPGSAVTASDGTVTITRRADGDFHVRAAVNGRPVGFQFDTGASAVVLRAEDAAALGIRPAESAFTVRVSTANGTTLTAPILLDTLQVGAIVERRVPALVSRPGDLHENLLGMTFLDRLAGFDVRGDRLILRGR